jgi:uncharacterized protein
MIKYLGKCVLIEDNGKKILAIGDLHLGYEEVLNESGVFVTREMFKEMLGYLDRVFAKSGNVDEVVLLGDIKHEFGRIGRQEWSDALQMFEYLGEKCDRVIVVKGNHDNIIEPIIRMSGVVFKDYYISNSVCFVHGDKAFVEMNRDDVKTWVMGHGHPAIKIGDGVKVEKYKCFLEGIYMIKKVIIVPSFIEANQGSDPRENDLGMAWDFKLGTFDVKVVGDDLDVLTFGKLKEIN